MVILGVVILTVLTAPIAVAAPGPSSSSTTRDSAPDPFAEISLDSVTPSMVTTTSAPTVSVRGRVQNRSNRTLRDVDLRLERGDPVDSAPGLRRSLAVAHPPIAVASPFRRIADELAPGAGVTFTITLSLSGDDGLRIARTGVYPLQVNANAVPDYGDTAQVGGSRTLLPVLSLPPDRARAQQFAQAEESGSETPPGLGADGSVSADSATPSRMTMLWPLAAPPQLAPGVLGGDTEPVRLISEDLARSLESGRLRSVLDPLRGVVGDPGPEAPDGSGSASAGSDESGSGGSGSTGSGSSGSESGQSESGESGSAGSGSAGSDTGSSTPGSASGSAAPGADGEPAPQNSALARSLCVAVDPDLLVTVRAMSLGYVVSRDPTDPTSATVPGTGQGAAAEWLDDLRRIASRTCVVALPFAQASLVGLARIGSPGLTDAALKSPADVVDAILGVNSVRGLVIPALGGVDDTGTALLQSAGLPRVTTSASTVRPVGDPAESGAYRIGAVTAQTFDQPVTAALSGLGSAPSTPVLTPPDQIVDLAGESAVSRRQAAVGALAFGSIGAGVDPNAAAADTGTSDDATAEPAASLPVVGRSQLVMPPTYWSPTADDADALLNTATVLLGANAAEPRTLPQLISAMASPGRGDLVDPPGVGPIARRVPELSDIDAAAIRTQVELSWQFQGSLVSSADVDASPERYMAPLREDMMRAIRSPGRLGVRSELLRQRDRAVTAVTATLNRMRNAVTILDPGGRYTLASERSPLLLVVRNDLSLPVRVRINSTAPDDIDIGDVGGMEIPARGTRQIQLPTRAQTSEAITITIAMDTVTGVTVGSPIKLSVNSNAYGKPLFIVTICAAVALVLLTARRLWHRFRGTPDPADADRPEAGEADRALAASTYQQRRRTLLNEAAETQPDLPDGHRSPGGPRPADSGPTSTRPSDHPNPPDQPNPPENPNPPDSTEGTTHR